MLAKVICLNWLGSWSLLVLLGTTVFFRTGTSEHYSKDLLNGTPSVQSSVLFTQESSLQGTNYVWCGHSWYSDDDSSNNTELPFIICPNYKVLTPCLNCGGNLVYVPRSVVFTGIVHKAGYCVPIFLGMSSQVERGSRSTRNKTPILHRMIIVSFINIFHLHDRVWIDFSVQSGRPALLHRISNSHILFPISGPSLNIYTQDLRIFTTSAKII